jgi:hypothetical protein
MESDPLDQLKDWAREAERRAQRAHRLSVSRSLPRRAVRWFRWPVLLLVLLVAAGAWYVNRYGLPAGNPRGDAAPAVKAYPTITHPSGVYATSSTGASPAPPKNPFADTPAEKYVEGAAGFVLPPAGPVGTFTTAQVAESLDQIRHVLTAIYLDHRLLVDHDPAALLALIAPSTRDDIRKQYADPTKATLGVLISPAVRLAADQPRVDGRTTIRAAKDSDGREVLEIITNYVVAYAFDRPDRGPGSRIALAHQQISWWVYHSNAVRTGDRGLWLNTFDGYQFNVDCVEFRKGLLAPDLGRGGVSSSVSPEPDAGYYDPDHTLGIPESCR